MKVYALATFKDDDNWIIGARLIDLDDNNKIMDVAIQDIYDAMVDKRIDVINFKLDSYSSESEHLAIRGENLGTSLRKGVCLRGRYCKLSDFPTLGLAELKYENTYISELENYINQLNRYTIGYIKINDKVENNYMAQLHKLTPLFIDKETNSVLVSNLRGTQRQAEKMSELDSSRVVTNKCSYREIDGTISYYNDKRSINKDTSVEGLDAQVGDPSIVWSISDFEKYMKSHNYSYKMSVLGRLGNFIYTGEYDNNYAYVLSDISTDCKIIHIPDGVVKVKNLYNGSVSEIDTLIMSPTVTEMNYNIFEDRETNEDSPKVIITNIYFQDRNYSHTSFQLSMFRNLHIIGDIVLTKNFYTIENLFRNCVIDSPQNLITNGNNLIKCFEECVFASANNVITIENAKRITDCFNQCTNLKSVSIKLTEKDNISVALQIEHSFCENDIEGVYFEDENRMEIRESFNQLKKLKNLEIENSPFISCKKSFNQCESLKEIDTCIEYNFSTISGSFNECKSLTRVDLSGCKELRSMREDIFGNCGSLSELIVPNGTMYINCDLTKSKIKYMRIPSQTSIINYEGLPQGITLDFSENKGRLSGKAVMFNHPGVELNIQNGFKQLDMMTDNLFENFDKILEQNSITSVAQSFLSYSNLDLRGRVFDTLTYLPDITDLNSGAFYCTNCSTIIINDNIRKLGYNIFQGCEASRVCISDKVVEIPEEAFDGHSTSTTYYVIKGSEAYKVLRKKKARVKIIESIQDFIEMVGDSASDNIQKKYNMLLSGSKFEVLLSDLYIGNIDQLYKMYYMLDANEEDTTGHVLDTSKFRSIELHRIEGLKIRVDMLMKDSETLLPPSRRNRNSFSNEFISLCNLYTKVCGDYDEAYSDSFIDAADCGEVDSTIIYADNLSQIIRYNFLAVDNIRLHMLAIIIKDRIVFNTPVSKMNKKVIGFNLENVFSPLYNFLTGDNSAVNEYFSSIYKYAQESDSLPLKSLNLKPIPPELASIVTNRITRTSRFIGSTNVLNKMIEAESKQGSKKNLPLLIYDVEIQRFIQLEWEVTGTIKQKAVALDRIDRIDIVKIYEFDEFDKISKAYLRDLYSVVNDEKNINTLRICCQDKNKIGELKNKPNAYNIKDGLMLSVCDAIYKHNITHPNQLTQKMFDTIAQTGLIRSVSMSINNLRNDPHMKQNFYETATPNELIVEYCRNNPVDNTILGTQYYIAYLTGTTSLKAKSGIVFESEKTLVNVLKCLRAIGELRQNPESSIVKPIDNIVRMTNGDIDIPRYYFMATHSLGVIMYYAGYKIDLAIHADTGFTSFIIERWDLDFRELFRFKKYGDAMEFFKRIVKVYEDSDGFGDKNNELTWITELYTEMTSDTYSSRKLETRKWREVRQVIMNGAPNGFPIIAEKEKIEMFNKLVKQPAIQKTV